MVLHGLPGHAEIRKAAQEALSGKNVPPSYALRVLDAISDLVVPKSEAESAISNADYLAGWIERAGALVERNRDGWKVNASQVGYARDEKAEQRIRELEKQLVDEGGWEAGAAIEYEKYEARIAELEQTIEELEAQLEDSDPRSDEEECKAIIRHGPGHQSRTRCELTGPHELHETHVHGERLRWRGEEGITGFFDESPEDPDA